MKSKFSILLGPLVFLLLTFCFPKPESMSTESWYALGISLWILIYWITEAIPIAVTSLLPIVLYPATGVLTMNQAVAPYSRSMIFLFLGGFILALAIEKWALHKRIALGIIYQIGTNQKQIILGFIVATGLLSMFISNTSAVMMMMPIGLAICQHFSNAKSDTNNNGFGKALMLAIAYAASIGGVATLIGTPTNLIFMDSVKTNYGIDFAFEEWAYFGVPVAMVLLLVCWLYITRFAFKLNKNESVGSKAIIKNQLTKLGRMGKEERLVLIIFLLVALAWMMRKYLINPWFPFINDTHIALMGAISLFILPAPSLRGQKLMDWKTALKLPWGILLLFGGAFCVAEAFKTSGLTLWLGNHLALLKEVPAWMILAIIVLGVNFLTEITLNMATCTLMMPILAALAPVINIHPFVLMAATAVASSCAFMLPVATAPNAIVFGAGFLQIKDMVRAGFLLNILSILIITLFVYFLLPLIWGIDIASSVVEY